MSKKPPAPSDVADKFMLRLPDGMRDRIKSAADANGRSMNAEIVSALEDKYPPPDFEKLAKFYEVVTQIFRDALDSADTPSDLKRSINDSLSYMDETYGRALAGETKEGADFWLHRYGKIFSDIRAMAPEKPKD